MNDVMSDLARLRGRTFETKLRCPCRIDDGTVKCGEAVGATVFWTRDDDTELVSFASTCKSGHTLDRVDDIDHLTEQVREGCFASPTFPELEEAASQLHVEG
jgi:hypothetical protein